MFQPKGPNFLLSIIRALKKHRLNISLLYYTGFAQDSNSASSSAKYDLSMLLLRPFGGSIVVLTPFCTMETGNLSEGIVVNQILKLESSSSISSKIASRIGMKLGARWQFCKTTHSD